MKRILSLLLIVILSLPSIFGLNHFLNEDHIVCNEQETHVHELEIDCLTCDYLRKSFDYSFNEFENSDSNFLNTAEYKISIIEIFSSNFINGFDSRGPPANC
ncbi:MAG: hypothetical protein HN595_06135 [Flavobacteriaceae bacterium]|nr:hypothetical protein [Flavobacteriaceae bacterium]